jgi:hypothetical protein
MRNIESSQHTRDMLQEREIPEKRLWRTIDSLDRTERPEVLQPKRFVSKTMMGTSRQRWTSRESPIGGRRQSEAAEIPS